MRCAAHLWFRIVRISRVRRTKAGLTGSKEIVMANTIVTGDQYMQIDDKIREIKRQLRQRNGYPFSVGALERALQRIVEGEFLHEASVAQPAAARSESQTGILKINRSTPFNPATFIGKGWSIWRGSANGDGLGGKEQQCKESLALTEVNIATITLEICRNGDGTPILGEEFLHQLKRDTSLLLDANVGRTLYENPDRIPESWKRELVFFMGTELRDPRGNRCVLCLCWDWTGWRWRYRWLGNDSYSGSSAAVGGK